MRSVILYRHLNGKLRSIKTDLNVLRKETRFVGVSSECFVLFRPIARLGWQGRGSSRTSTVLNRLADPPRGGVFSDMYIDDFILGGGSSVLIKIPYCTKNVLEGCGFLVDLVP